MTSEKLRPDLALMNGRQVPYAEAAVHPLSTAFKYGAIVFEGLRGYWNESQEEMYVFRMGDHLKRLRDSCLLSGMPFDDREHDLEAQVLRLIRDNGIRQNVHIRIQVYVDTEDGKIYSTDPVAYTAFVMPMQGYFESKGLDIAVSSWRRISDSAMPPRIKAVPNYHNGRLAVLQAKRDGYDDVVLLTEDGRVSEGPGYAIFLVRDGEVMTPRLSDSILESLTRDSIIRLLRDEFAIATAERAIDRSELYLADEAFFCGSAAEVAPITSIDRIELSGGRDGSIASRVGGLYRSYASGKHGDAYGWLTPVYGSNLGVHHSGLGSVEGR